MAFDALSSIPEQAYLAARSEAVAAKEDSERAISKLQSTGASADEVVRWINTLTAKKARLESYAAVTDMQTYLDSIGKSGELAELNSLISAVASVITEIETTFPADGNGYLLGWTLDPTSKALVPRTFTPAQTGGLQTALQGIIDAVI